MRNDNSGQRTEWRCTSFILCAYTCEGVRKLDVSDIEESMGACVHDVVTHLLPVKVSKRNFDGQMSDARKCLSILD